MWRELHQGNAAVRVTLSRPEPEPQPESHEPTESSHDLWLVPVGAGGEEAVGRFLIYALPKPSAPSLRLLSNHELALVVGLEYSLLRFYDLESRVPPREVELAMLAEFDATGRVTLPGGRVVQAELEESLVDARVDPVPEDVDAAKDEPLGETGWRPSMGAVVHPVLQLHSAQGSIVFTKIMHGARARSFLVHVRPGWVALKEYVLGKSARGGESPTPHRLFRIHPVAKEARGNLALELWRLLDPESLLVPKDDVVSGAGLLRAATLDAPENVLMSPTLAMGPTNTADALTLALVVDNSTRWLQPDLVWPIRAYDPYVTPLDSGLMVAMQVAHDVRNDFYYRCDHLKASLGAWVGAAPWKRGSTLPPAPPTVRTLLTALRHKWLQEFQSAHGRVVPAELEAARDFVDPQLRNKHHLVIDTNVLLLTVADRFELFENLKHAHSDKIVVVVPQATVAELDWQKHNSKDANKQQRAQACIRYINSFVAANSPWLVLQSPEEDAPAVKRAEMADPTGGHNSRNDRRVLDAAKLRHDAGLKTILVSGDVNLRNLALASGVPAVRAQSLWRLLCDPRLQRLGPEHWVKAVADIERSRVEQKQAQAQAQAQQQQQQQQQGAGGMKRVRVSELEEDE